MASVHKFLFDRSFDEPRIGQRRRGGSDTPPAEDATGASAADEAATDGDAGGEANGYVGLDRRRHAREEPPTPPPEMFSQEQLEAAREEGYIKGHTAALEEAAKADGHVTANAVKRVAEAIDRMDAADRDHALDLEKMAIRLALTVARQILPATGEQAATTEIERLVARVLPDLLDQPRLVVRVHGAIAEVVRGAVRDLQASSGYEGRVVVRPDNALGRQDCRLEWGEGGTERDTDRLWADIEAAVARHLDEPVPPAAPRPSQDDDRDAPNDDAPGWNAPDDDAQNGATPDDTIADGVTDDAVPESEPDDGFDTDSPHAPASEARRGAGPGTSPPAAPTAG
ncbi:hypothetical protein F1188_08830 [Roseospira marina]|uniref:Uncharacterized protein n=1 Tax=Roseospira marina TaxID=140057 RepID=A0A5M6IBQ4_9PROT|nr:FliH/SctL family protein [Roseospira marina]KAA5605720.1 hypothetical protein F1188_08830 [Roseospira marina]MBB4313521.1 flagellar assembly protein FliH [Roseospira marina]MBB5086683.1 flagellar assembly protein FliH [Roseospira marina]